MVPNTAEPYRHALIFGASGVSGWAVVDQLLKGYPNNARWDKVTALTNRPLGLEVSQWPKKDSLHIVSGINLLYGSAEDLLNVMKQKINDVERVTHIFYYGERQTSPLWMLLRRVASIQSKHGLSAGEERCRRHALTLDRGH